MLYLGLLYCFIIVRHFGDDDRVQLSTFAPTQDELKNVVEAASTRKVPDSSSRLVLHRSFRSYHKLYVTTSS